MYKTQIHIYWKLSERDVLWRKDKQFKKFWKPRV